MKRSNPAEVQSLRGVLFWRIWKRPQNTGALIRAFPACRDKHVESALTWLRDYGFIRYNGRVWFTTSGQAQSMRKLQSGRKLVTLLLSLLSWRTRAGCPPLSTYDPRAP